MSFVVPAFNEEALIARCLNAIIKEINRSKCDSEIIVVDNASTDKTNKIASSIPGVKVVYEPVKGLVQARRAGFMASKGDLIANIDADTLLPEGWLNTAIREFSKSSAMVALSGPYIYYDAPLRVRLMTRLFYRVSYCFYRLNRLLKVGSMLQGGNFIVRREAINAIGGFNLDFNFYGEDTDLARRLSLVGQVKFTFDLPALSSGRRFVGEGILMVGWRYTMNFFWATFMKRPFTDEWNDFRVTTDK